MLRTYFALSVIGLLLPWSQLIPFILQHGVDLSLFWSQLFVNRASSADGLDLFVSSVVFWLFLFREGTKLQMKLLWVYVVLNLTVGLSFALPLFLAMRCKQLDSRSHLPTISEA